MIHKSYMWEKLFYESAFKALKMQFQFWRYLEGTHFKNWKTEKLKKMKKTRNDPQIIYVGESFLWKCL